MRKQHSESKEEARPTPTLPAHPSIFAWVLDYIGEKGDLKVAWLISKISIKTGRYVAQSGDTQTGLSGQCEKWID
jgi:hypothetical protein